MDFFFISPYMNTYVQVLLLQRHLSSFVSVPLQNSASTRPLKKEMQEMQEKRLAFVMHPNRSYTSVDLSFFYF